MFPNVLSLAKIIFLNTCIGLLSIYFNTLDCKLGVSLVYLYSQGPFLKLLAEVHFILLFKYIHACVYSVNTVHTKAMHTCNKEMWLLGRAYNLAYSIAESVLHCQKHQLKCSLKLLFAVQQNVQLLEEQFELVV